MSGPGAKIVRMEQRGTHVADDELARRAQEADAARAAQLRRDAALTPAQRLEKLAAVCRQADLLRDARRLP
jgi:hypothetical protein